MAVPHSLSSVNAEARTAICSVCGPTGIRRRGQGEGAQFWRCRTSANRHKRKPGQRFPSDFGRRRGYRREVGDTCQRCGWVADDQRLLDVHHVDGDHENNDPANLRTLCPICHRREHYGI